VEGDHPTHDELFFHKSLMKRVLHAIWLKELGYFLFILIDQGFSKRRGWFLDF
jgi:hypothetical protein